MAKSVSAPAYDYKGAKTGRVTLPGEIFAAKINQSLMVQAVKVFLNNQRLARPKAKTRGEVVGSRRKIWRQKGTGRARHGSVTAPIFVGGGVAHGPRCYSPKRLKMSKKMKRQALFSALTFQAQEKNVVILKDGDKLGSKTKAAQLLFKKMLGKELPKSLLIFYEIAPSLERATKNLAFLDLLSVEELNAYLILNFRKIIITQKAMDQIKKIFLKK